MGAKKMKKRSCALLIALVFMLLVGGCNSVESTPPVQSEMPSSPAPSEDAEQSETPSSPAPTVYVESTLENFHIAIVTDELLNKYTSYHEYISDELERIIIWTDTDIKDFAFITVDYNDTGDKISYLAGDILSSLDELSPEKPFVADIFPPEIFPVNGISFLDVYGVRRYFSILMDGRGVEEAPPYFFLEFENGGGFLPASPLSS